MGRPFRLGVGLRARRLVSHPEANPGPTSEFGFGLNFVSNWLESIGPGLHPTGQADHRHETARSAVVERGVGGRHVLAHSIELLRFLIARY